MSRDINSTTTHLNLGYISIFTNLLHLLNPDVVHKAFLLHTRQQLVLKMTKLSKFTLFWQCYPDVMQNALWSWFCC